MITLSGTLQKQSDSSLCRYLHCDLGRFLIDDKRLAFTCSGEQEGFFEIKKIKLKAGQQLENGGVVINIVAELGRFWLDRTQSDLSKEANVSDPQLSLTVKEAVDASVMPLEKETEEEATATITEAVLSTSPVNAAETRATAIIEPPTALTDVLEMPAEWGDKVVLDSTLPRPELIQAVERLKASGYTFDKTHQVWLKAA